jgi:hypothetical protein
LECALYSRFSVASAFQLSCARIKAPPADHDQSEEGGQAAKKKTPKKKPDTTTTTDSSVYIRNQDFDPEFKQMGVEMGKITTFLKKIGPGDNQPATCPMIRGHQACLTWQVKGHCWDHCDKSATHVKLSDTEKASLATFIQEGFNSIE